MKNSLFLILFFLTVRTYSQTINYCDYFSLDVSEIDYNGKKVKSYSPKIIGNKKDKVHKFIKQHQLRFDYILFKNSAKYKDIADNYPDTNKIYNEFCSKVVKTNEVVRYLRSMTPKKMTTWTESKDTFSVAELMEVASKFFFCDAINKKDTIIQSHICVGINGTKDIKSEKDLTLLEAFSIEAIFEYLTDKKEPLFYTEFYNYKNKMTRERLFDFKDFDSFLLEIRNLCYEKMKNNDDLKNKLLLYYNRNRNNLNFEIK